MNMVSKKLLARSCPHALLAAVLLCSAGHTVAQGKYFRYINDEGVKVIASSIPPQFVDNGYEVLGPTGQVVRVVDPAPAPEDVARVEQERALLAQYEILARRYSSEADILSARDRRLAHLTANIAILRGNIGNFTAQIDDLMSKAAQFEREGREVPAHIFKSIDEIRLEIASTEDVLESRIRENDEIKDKFAEDMRIYNEGRALLEQKRTAADRSGTPHG